MTVKAAESSTYAVFERMWDGFRSSKQQDEEEGPGDPASSQAVGIW